MRLSKRSEYGLKAAVRLARSYGRGYVQSREIADAEHLPPKFLESILFALRSASILDSKVGAGGGYRLSRAPEQVCVQEVIDALETAEMPVPPIDVTPLAESSIKNGAVNGHRHPPHRNGNGSTGGMALDILNSRILGALTEAIGGLTLSELIALAEARQPARTDAMYYI